MITLTDKEIRVKLREACEKAGSQKAWAKKNCLSEAYVSEVIRGKSIGKSILEALGYNKDYSFKQN